MRLEKENAVASCLIAKILRIIMPGIFAGSFAKRRGFSLSHGSCTAAKPLQFCRVRFCKETRVAKGDTRSHYSRRLRGRPGAHRPGVRALVYERSQPGIMAMWHWYRNSAVGSISGMASSGYGSLSLSLSRILHSRLLRFFLLCAILGVVALCGAYSGWRYHIHRAAVHVERAQAQAAGIMEFSDFFRRPLMAEPPQDNIRAALRESLEKDWQNDEPWMKERFPDMDARERFIAYLLARVNGSLPVYHSTTTGSAKLEEMLWLPRGNCSHHSLRLSLVLDAFDIPSVMLSVVTPSFPGHVLVDAWDPVGKKAYWLDANFLTYASLDAPKKAGFGWQFLNMTPEERANAIQAVDFKILPWHFEWVDPDATVFRKRPLTAEMINSQRDSLAGKWQRFFGHELDRAGEFWKKAGLAHAPHGLQDFPNLGISDIARFAPETSLDLGYEKFWRDSQ